MALFFMLLEHGSGRHFFGSVTVAPRALSAFLDVLVLALFLLAHAAQVLFTWHRILVSTSNVAAITSLKTTIGGLDGSYHPANSVAQPHVWLKDVWLKIWLENAWLKSKQRENRLMRNEAAPPVVEALHPGEYSFDRIVSAARQNYDHILEVTALPSAGARSTVRNQAPAPSKTNCWAGKGKRKSAGSECDQFSALGAAHLSGRHARSRSH
jgi:hypothetical protein